MFSYSSKIQKRAENKMVKNWWLFRATDFHSLMYPCFILCCILGIFPYRMNNTTFKLSKPLFIVSTIIVYVCCIRVLIMIYDLNTSGRMDMTDMPKNIEISFYYVLSSFIAVVTHILSGPRTRLLQAIAKISSRLPMESYRKLSWLIHAKDIFGAIYIFLISTSTFIINPDIFLTFSIVHINLVVYQINMMYINCVCILKACFERINDNLVNMQMLVVNNTTHYLGLINHDQRNSLLLQKLKTLQKQYLMISDTVQMVNMNFSLQLIATIIMTFADITFHLYYYILAQREIMIIMPVKKQVFYIYSVLFMLFFLTKIILIIWACESGKKQASEIGTTVHDVLNCTSDKQIKDEVLKHLT
ncbi:hypothetical protein P5V15_009553 [Pogonomyrmex californicus]